MIFIEIINCGSRWWWSGKQSYYVDIYLYATSVFLLQRIKTYKQYDRDITLHTDISVQL